MSVPPTYYTQYAPIVTSLESDATLEQLDNMAVNLLYNSVYYCNKNNNSAGSSNAAHSYNDILNTDNVIQNGTKFAVKSQTTPSENIFNNDYPVLMTQTSMFDNNEFIIGIVSQADTEQTQPKQYDIALLDGTTGGIISVDDTITHAAYATTVGITVSDSNTGSIYDSLTDENWSILLDTTDSSYALQQYTLYTHQNTTTNTSSLSLQTQNLFNGNFYTTEYINVNSNTNQYTFGSTMPGLSVSNFNLSFEPNTIDDIKNAFGYYKYHQDNISTATLTYTENGLPFCYSDGSSIPASSTVVWTENNGWFLTTSNHGTGYSTNSNIFSVNSSAVSNLNYMKTMGYGNHSVNITSPGSISVDNTYCSVSGTETLSYANADASSYIYIKTTNPTDSSRISNTYHKSGGFSDAEIYLPDETNSRSAYNEYYTYLPYNDDTNSYEYPNFNINTLSVSSAKYWNLHSTSASRPTNYTNLIVDTNDSTNKAKNITYTDGLDQLSSYFSDSNNVFGKSIDSLQLTISTTITYTGSEEFTGITGVSGDSPNTNKVLTTDTTPISLNTYIDYIDLEATGYLNLNAEITSNDNVYNTTVATGKHLSLQLTARSPSNFTGNFENTDWSWGVGPNGDDTVPLDSNGTLIPFNILHPITNGVFGPTYNEENATEEQINNLKFDVVYVKGLGVQIQVTVCNADNTALTGQDDEPVILNYTVPGSYGSIAGLTKTNPVSTPIFVNGGRMLLPIGAYSNLYVNYPSFYQTFSIATLNTNSTTLDDYRLTCTLTGISSTKYIFGNGLNLLYTHKANFVTDDTTFTIDTNETSQDAPFDIWYDDNPNKLKLNGSNIDATIPWDESTAVHYGVPPVQGIPDQSYTLSGSEILYVNMTYSYIQIALSEDTGITYWSNDSMSSQSALSNGSITVDASITTPSTTKTHFNINFGSQKVIGFDLDNLPSDDIVLYWQPTTIFSVSYNQDSSEYMLGSSDDTYLHAYNGIFVPYTNTSLQVDYNYNFQLWNDSIRYQDATGNVGTEQSLTDGLQITTSNNEVDVTFNGYRGNKGSNSNTYGSDYSSGLEISRSPATGTFSVGSFTSSNFNISNDTYHVNYHYAIEPTPVSKPSSIMSTPSTQYYKSLELTDATHHYDAVAISTDGNIVCTISNQKQSLKYSIDGGHTDMSLSAVQSAQFTDMVMSSDGKYVLYVADGAQCSTINFTGTTGPTLYSQGLGGVSVAINPTGQYQVIGKDDGTLLYSNNYGENMPPISNFNAGFPINSVAVSQDGNYIAFINKDNLKKIYVCTSDGTPFPNAYPLNYSNNVNKIAFVTNNHNVLLVGDGTSNIKTVEFTSPSNYNQNFITARGINVDSFAVSDDFRVIKVLYNNTIFNLFGINGSKLSIGSFVDYYQPVDTGIYQAKLLSQSSNYLWHMMSSPSGRFTVVSGIYIFNYSGFTPNLKYCIYINTIPNNDPNYATNLANYNNYLTQLTEYQNNPSELTVSTTDNSHSFGCDIVFNYSHNNSLYTTGNSGTINLSPDSYNVNGTIGYPANGKIASDPNGNDIYVKSIYGTSNYYSIDQIVPDQTYQFYQTSTPLSSNVTSVTGWSNNTPNNLYFSAKNTYTPGTFYFQIQDNQIKFTAWDPNTNQSVTMYVPVLDIDSSQYTPFNGYGSTAGTALNNITYTDHTQMTVNRYYYTLDTTTYYFLLKSTNIGITQLYNYNGHTASNNIDNVFNGSMTELINIGATGYTGANGCVVTTTSDETNVYVTFQQDLTQINLPTGSTGTNSDNFIIKVQIPIYILFSQSAYTIEVNVNNAVIITAMGTVTNHYTTAGYTGGTGVTGTADYTGNTGLTGPTGLSNKFMDFDFMKADINNQNILSYPPTQLPDSIDIIQYRTGPISTAITDYLKTYITPLFLPFKNKRIRRYKYDGLSLLQTIADTYPDIDTIDNETSPFNKRINYYDSIATYCGITGIDGDADAITPVNSYDTLSAYYDVNYNQTVTPNFKLTDEYWVGFNIDNNPPVGELDEQSADDTSSLCLTPLTYYAAKKFLPDIFTPSVTANSKLFISISPPIRVTLNLIGTQSSVVNDKGALYSI